MRWTFALLLLASAAFAQGMPPFARVDSWTSPHNQKRLRLEWEVLPPYKPTKLPDGSEEPPKAPWPFVLYVFPRRGTTTNTLNGTMLFFAKPQVNDAAIGKWRRWYLKIRQ